MVSLPRLPSPRSALAGIPSSATGFGNSADWFTWLLLVSVCVAFFGQVPPDVNESHYLTKARHFWNPQWCAGDLFLESADAHWLFLAATGWVSRLVSLETYAWLGRLLSWMLIAAAWRQLSGQIQLRSWFSLLSFLLFLLFNLRFHLAGEWVVGGFEGKPLAYACGLWGVAAWLRGDWPLLGMWLGAAIGWHALAGGWLALGIGLASLTFGWQEIRSAIRGYPPRGSVRRWLPIGAGVVLALAGLLPGLLSQIGSTAEARSEAAWIQVTERLSHHLWFTAFSTSRIAGFGVLVGFACCLATTVAWPRPLLMLFRLALIGVLFNLAGLCLSAQVAEQSAGATWACELLRFYWFRFADFALPLAVALGVSWLLESWTRPGSPRARSVISRGVAMLLVGAAGLQAAENWRAGRAGADAAGLETFPTEPQKELQLAANWRQVCRWIAAETPIDSIFVTPARQQSFKWYAGRAEVVCWKDMPQDPAGIVEWATRLQAIYRPQMDYELGLLAYDDEQLRDLGVLYGADYLVLRQADHDRVRGRCRLPQVYPGDPAARVSFVVLSLAPESGPASD